MQSELQPVVSRCLLRREAPAVLYIVTRWHHVVYTYITSIAALVPFGGLSLCCPPPLLMSTAAAHWACWPAAQCAFECVIPSAVRAEAATAVFAVHCWYRRYQLPVEPPLTSASAAVALAAIDAQERDAELRADLMANALLLPLLGELAAQLKPGLLVMTWHNPNIMFAWP